MSRGQIVHLPEAIKPYASKVLLVYGGGSIKKSGLYDTITQLFRENGGSRPEGIAVNAVVTDHQRNAETGFGVHRFHGFRQVGG